METSSDFHQLLVFLLDDFSKHITLLHRFSELPIDRFPEITEEQDVSVNKELLVAFVRRIAICGNILRYLVYSSALEIHFNRICMLLGSSEGLEGMYDEKEDAHSDTQDMQDDIDEEIDDDGEDAEDDGEDVNEHDRMDLGKGKEVHPLVTTYMRWLRLQVFYFESVRLLCRVGRRLSEISRKLSVKVVTTNHPGIAMQPWEDVVTILMASLGNEDITSAINLIQELGTRKVEKLISFIGTLHCEACLGSLASDQMVLRLISELEVSSHSL
jgi:hypothetical protein